MKQPYTQRMRQLRQELGLSTARAAVGSGMDPATWNRIEKGHVSPNLRTLNSIAEGLGVSVVELLEEQPRPKAQSPLWSADLSPEERAALESIKEINDELAEMQRDNPTVIRVALNHVYRHLRLIPALMQNDALAEVLRPETVRMAELGRELLEAAQRSGELPENAEKIGQVIDATGRFRAA